VKTALLACLMLISGYGWSQTFPVTGQRPSTAFPVCGSAIFKQATVPEGNTNFLLAIGCPDKYPDQNPFWYSFTCYAGGTLGFVITPNVLNDDYDWQLFDVTGHDPGEVFTNSSLTIIGNWSGSSGLTGAKTGGSYKTECASDPRTQKIPTFSKMPTLIKGHKYLLLVSHYTNSQSGYSLSFGGGTAVITDSVMPHLKSAAITCDRKSITISLNKKMRCASVAPDGSDFRIGSSPVTVISASGLNCNNQFDMDSLKITLSAPLDPGNYSVLAKTGSDDNTLLDDCGTPVQVDENVSFTVLPPHPTPLDSLTTPSCAPNILQLVFSDPIQCNSIAPDGSDFIISGNPAIGISKVSGICANGLTSVINIELNSPAVAGGNYVITLKPGTDGNTIINECDQETPAGSTISFHLKDTVSASFNYNINFGCKYDTIHLNYTATNGVDQWEWIIDSTYSNSLLDPSIVEAIFGPKNIQHIVSNGFCSDTVSKFVDLDNTTRAAFQSPNEVCPKDAITFSNISIGHLVSWNWNFGDGSSSSEQNPPAHLYPDTWTGKTYIVSLVVKNDLGCYDTLSKPITKLQSCYITVPNAFTPNGDGRNDFLYPLNAFTATHLEFRVFNRYGQLVFETSDWSRKWDGTISGVPQPTGSYVWTLRYTDGSSGKSFFLRGSSTLIR
jgi:gliding motility-associated-like protein